MLVLKNILFGAIVVSLVCTIFFLLVTAPEDFRKPLWLTTCELVLGALTSASAAALWRAQRYELMALNIFTTLIMLVLLASR